MDAFGAVINQINSVLWSYVLIVLLIGLGLYFTFRTGFIQIRYAGEMFRVLTEGAGSKPKDKEISSFQAFCVSTASRVGVGNIAGVAIAIVLGGPGAVFWMWIVAIVGAATGFVESTLAQIYKIPKEGGAFHGGPAYYIQNALHMPNLAKLFSLLLLTTFALVYNSLQASTITLSLESAFGWDRAVVGVVIAILAGLVICGGAQTVAKVAEKMVPIMAGIYLVITMVVMVMNVEKLPSVIGLIISNAFVPQAFGVYVDTLLICSASAFLVLLSGVYEIGGKVTGIALVQKALSAEVGGWAISFIAFMILMFAFSSLVGNYYYGEINLAFLSGSKTALYVFRILVIAMILFGSVASLPLVWDLADLFMAFLATTNLYAIARLFKFSKIALDDYQAQKDAGADPVFNPSILPSLDGVQAWGVEQKKK